MPLAKSLALLSGTLVLFGLLAGSRWVFDPWPQAHAQEPRRYFFRVVEVPADTVAMQLVLNEYGAAGWDLAAIEMAQMQTPRFVFKK